jgi:hypothetical protein
MSGLTVADIRAAVKHLKEVAITGDFKLPMRQDIRLTVSGVVWIPGNGFMHHETFREYAGEEAYQWLLAQPRVVTPYDTEEEKS